MTKAHAQNAIVRDRLSDSPHVVRDVAIIRAVASCASIARDGLAVASAVDCTTIQEENLIGYMVYLAKVREEIVAAVARETGVDLLEAITGGSGGDHPQFPAWIESRKATLAPPETAKTPADS